MADSTEVRNLLLQINANTELLRSNLSQAEKAVAAFHSSTQTHLDATDQRFESLGKSIEKLQQPLEKLKGFGEFAIGSLIGESLIEAGKHALEFAGNVQFVSEQVGASTKFLQEYRFAASQFGIGAHDADEGLGKFTRSIGEAANGNKSLIELFDRLGVKVRDASGAVRSTEVVYKDFADAIAKVKSPAERSADTLQAFGKGAIGLVPLLSQGAAGFQTLADAAEALHVVLSPELIAHSEEFSHKMEALKQVLDAQLASAIANNAVQLEGLATSLLSVAGAMAKVTSEHPQLIAGLLGFAVGGPLGGAIGAGLASGDVGKQIKGTANVYNAHDNFLTGGAAVLSTSRQGLIDAANTGDANLSRQILQLKAELDRLNPKDPNRSIQGLRTDIQRKIGTLTDQLGHPVELPNEKEGAAGSDRPGATNNNGGDVKKVQDQLAELQKAKVGANGAALTAINDEIGERKRELGFLKQGVSAETAKTLASKEGAAITKGENDAKKAAKKAEEERVKAIEEDLAYRAQELKLRKSLLEGAKSSTANDAARDLLQKAIVNEEADTLKAQIADRLSKTVNDPDAPAAAKATAKAHAASLTALNEQNRQQGLLNVDLARLVQQQKDATDKADLALQGATALVQLDDRLALTRADRLKFELQLLDLQEQQVKAAQQAIIDSKDPKVTQQQRDNAQTRIDQVNAQHGRNVEQVKRTNADPLQSYGLQLQQSVGDLNDAYKGVEANGLKSLKDGFVGVISGTESVASAFKTMAESIIADLARIAIEKAIVSTLGSFLGLSAGGPIVGHADGGILAGYAGGGQIHGPGTGRSDSILALVNGRSPIRVANGEYIINAASTAKHIDLIRAINEDRLPKFADGGLVAPSALAIPSVSRADMRAIALQRQGSGAMEHRVKVDIAPSPLFQTQVTQLASQIVYAASPSIVTAATANTMDQIRRPSLPGSGG